MRKRRLLRVKLLETQSDFLAENAAKIVERERMRSYLWERSVRDLYVVVFVNLDVRLVVRREKRISGNERIIQVVSARISKALTMSLTS